MRNIEGVDRVVIDRENWSLRIRYDPARVTLARIQAEADAAADAADAQH